MKLNKMKRETELKYEKMLRKQKTNSKIITKYDLII